MLVSQAEGLEGHGRHGSPQLSRDFRAKLAKLAKTKPGLEILEFQHTCKNYKNIKLTRMMGLNISFPYYLENKGSFKIICAIKPFVFPS